MDKYGEGFKYVRQIFPQLSDKLCQNQRKYWLSNQKANESENFKNILNINEKVPWEAFEKRS